MEDRAPSASLTSWSELRLDLEPSIKSKILQIRLPDRSTFGRFPKGGQRVIDSLPECKSEDEYKKRRFASAASVFFREEGQFPRNILWRLLGDSTTLELRSVDLWKKDNNKHGADAPNIIQLTFPSPIRNGCVGFAESDRGKSFDVFVFTESKELYTLTIPSVWFRVAEQSDNNLEQWSHTMRPGTLAVGQVLKLSSAQPHELLFSMTDGRIVRLTRQEKGNGTTWVESAYSSNQWSALRGLIPWQSGNKIKYEGQSLDPNTPLAVLPSPDQQSLISVTLSHTLKILDLDSNKTLFETDILGIEQDPNQPFKLTLDPGQKQVLAIDRNIRPPYWSSVESGDPYCIFTYSPHHGGFFKVWSVRDASEGRVEDAFPQNSLRVPDPGDSAVWTLADFRVGAKPGSSEFSFWIMLRLNRRYKIYHKAFSSIDALASIWDDDWEQTHVTDSVDVVGASDMPIITPSEPIGLALDTVDGLAWLTSTDAVSAVRTASDMEQLVYNRPWDLANTRRGVIQSFEGGDDMAAQSQASLEDCATLVQAAAHFRANVSSFPIEEATRTELWQDPSRPPADRVTDFWNRANFEEVQNRPFDELMASLKPMLNLDNFDRTLFETVLAKLPPDVAQDITFCRAHTAFGRKALIKGAQETVIIHERVISALLYTLVFVSEDLERDEFPLTNLFPGQVFESLVQELRRIQVERWLAFTTTSKHSHDIVILDDYRTSEVLFQPLSDQSASAALTGTIRDLTVYSAGGANGPLEAATSHILCHLLVQEDFALANEFLQYLPSDSWATYVRGRHCLCIEDHAAAAVYFKKAAYQCSRMPKNTKLVTISSGLLGALDLGRFGHGLAKYYGHIAELFAESASQAHIQVSTFASLALQHQQTYDHPEESLQQRSDLLLRLFRSSVALGDYDAAASAVSRYTDKALRKASLKELVSHMIAASAIRDLLDLTFDEHLKKEIDSILSARTQADALDGAEDPGSAVKILYAWRVRHNDYRGAAACLVERLQARRPAKRPRVRRVGAKDGVLDDYLISINALSLLGRSEDVEEADSEGWLFLDGGDANGPRSLVRLKDLRREYQEEIDRRERWQKGQFALTGMDDDDEYGDGDTIMAT